MKTVSRNALYFFLAVFLALIVCLSSFFSSRRVFAEAAVAENFDETPIENDIGDVDFLKYPKNPLGKASIVTFMEYCYSEKDNLSDNFGLYFYIYNPTEKSLRTETGPNTVEMACAYNVEGKPADYDQFPLVFLDCTDNYRFYKFRLKDASSVLDLSRENMILYQERRYDVASIQLWDEGALLPEDYAVSFTYVWTGYAHGCGEYANAESTLSCNASEFVTLDLPLYHYTEDGNKVSNQTYYRTDKSSLGANHQWQIDTVYFSINEDDLFSRAGEDLGILQKIKAKWYEYQTQPIYVTSDEKMKNAFTPYVGVDISSMSAQEIFDIGYGFGVSEGYVDGLNGDDDCAYWDWAYAMFEAPFRVPQGFLGLYDGYTNNVRSHLNQIDWLFQVDEAGENKISSDELWEYAKAYSEVHGAASLDSVDEADRYLALMGLSSTLFTDTTAVHGDGKEVKRGENILEFDSDATFDLRSYDSTLDGWDRFYNWVYGIKNGSSWEIKDMKPIEEVTKSALSSLNSDEAIAEQLKLNERDVPAFKSWAEKELEAGKKVYLFRFAVTDYTQETLSVQKHGDCSGVPSKTAHPISRAQEAVFFGFEVLTLTYNNCGKLNVIPVVQTPIHVFDDVDIYLAEDSFDWWKFLLAVILLLIILVLLFKFCPWLFKCVAFVVALPFKAVGAAGKQISNSVKKRKQKSEGSNSSATTHAAPPASGKNCKKSAQDPKNEIYKRNKKGELVPVYRQRFHRK